MSDEEKPKTIWQRAGEAYRHLVGIKEIEPVGTFSRQEDRGFTRLTGRSQKELPQLEWKRQMEIAYFLWLQNPITACLGGVCSAGFPGSHATDVSTHRLRA